MTTTHVAKEIVWGGRAGTTLLGRAAADLAQLKGTLRVTEAAS